LGATLETAGGKQPAYVIGFPFPAIDPADPSAGVKILWNFYYRTYYFGNLRAESQLNMMSPASLERRLDVDVRFMYYDGVPEQERVKNNPQNFLYQQLVVVMSPNDLQGTGSLSWRYRDPQKRDSSWAYVPALRRVRAVSPANRSDGFLGSDMSQDDGPFFDGKPEDFDWKLKGEVDNDEQVMAWNPHTVIRPDGKKDWVQGTNQAFQCAESIKLERATVAGIKSSRTANFDGRLVFDPKLFDLDALSQYGK